MEISYAGQGYYAIHIYATVSAVYSKKFGLKSIRKFLILIK
jgi:hypothetical protein